MNWKAARVIAAFTVLVLLHFTLRPLLGWRAGPDFLLIALLLASVRVRPGIAALIGFFLGLATDSIALTGFGAAAIAMSIVGFAAAWMKAVFFADNLALNLFFIFFGKWGFDVLYLLLEGRVTGIGLVQEVLLYSPLAAAVTAFVGILTLVILRPLLDPVMSS
jgi:rod shape-determining protein MreD